MKIVKVISLIKKRLTVFDYTLITGSFIILSFFFLFFLRKGEYVHIRVKVTDQNVLYAYGDPQTWYANKFEVGDAERDALGRVVSEIVSVDTFRVWDQQKVVYVDLNIKARYDSRTKLHSTKGKPIIFGMPVRFNLSKITFDGIVVEVPNQSKTDIVNYQVAKILLRGVGSQNMLVEPSVVESIKIGDKIESSNKNLIAEVENVEIRPAQHVVDDDFGNLYLRSDPLYKDGIYTIKFRVKDYNGEKYILDEMPLQVGQKIALSFPNTFFIGEIIELVN